MDIVLKYFSYFTPQQHEQLSALLPLYTEWNEKINVISRKDINSLYLKHVLHSLSVAALIQFKEKSRVLDIGTGGGFPGIPLAVFFPEVQFYLVDTIGKKITVVQQVIESLRLTNVSCEKIPAQEIRNKKFDFVVSRAVAPLKDLWSWSKTLLSSKNINSLNNGLICLKGGDLNKEISESNLAVKLVAVSSYFSETFFEEKYILYVPKNHLLFKD